MEKSSLRIALIVGGAMLMENLDGTAISTAIPQMAHDFDVNVVSMSAGITSYLIMLAVFIPISGWVADMFGTRKVFSAAIIGFLSASVCCGFSQSLPQFITARIFQGIAGAMMVPVGRLAVLTNTSKKDLIIAITYIAWPGLIGPVIGPTIGGFFTTYFTWHWIFFMNIPLGIIALWLAHKYIPNTLSDNRRPFDFVGFVLSGLGLSSFMYGIEMISRVQGHDYSKPIMILLASIILIMISYWHSKKKEFPLINYDVLKKRTYFISFFSGSLTRMVIGMSPFIFPLMFQIGFGLNPFESGLLFAVSMLGNISMKSFVAGITRRFTFRQVLFGNGLLLVGITLVQSCLMPETPIWMTAVVFFASGMVRSMQFSSLNTLTYAEVSQEEMSNANTLYSTIQQMSIGMGIALGAVVLHLCSLYHNTENHYTMPDFHMTLRILSVICLLSLLEYLRLKPNDGLNVRGLTEEPK